MAITVIAINNTGSSINLDDLGVILSSAETRNLTDYFDFIELTESEDLINNVSNGNIGINDGTNDLNIVDALQHLNFESEYQDLQQDASITGSVSTDLACVNVSNDNIVSINSNWTNSYFPSTDFENKPSIIEHDTSNTDRILIKEDGVYTIGVYFQSRMNNPTLDKCYYRILKNDTTVISLERYQNLYRNEIHSFADNITRTFIAGDYVTVQTKTDGNDADIIKSSFNVTKQEGVKGDTGLPGGTTVNILDDGNTIVQNSDKLNFIGNVTVSDAGNSQADINIVGNSHEFKYITVYDSNGNVDINQSTASFYEWNAQLIRDTDTFDHSTSTNSSRIYVLKDGLYKLSYTLCYDNTNSTRKNIKAYLRLNGSTEIILTTASSYVRNTTDDYGSITLPAVISSLSNGDYVELMYKREGSYGTVHTYANQCWLQMEYIRGI